MSRSMASLLVLLVLLMAAPLAAAPRTAAELNDAGKAAYGRGDFAAAEKLFGEAAAAAPREPLYTYHRGAALVRLGRLAEARQAYERARALQPPPPLGPMVDAALRELGIRPASRRAAAEDDAVPLENVNGVWFAEVTLNGDRRARFIVDTGASSCTISPALAEELSVDVPENAPTVEIMTMNGKTSGRVVSLDSIKVGQTEATDVSTIVQTLDVGADGILGNTFLSRYSVTLDAQRRLLRLRPKP